MVNQSYKDYMRSATWKRKREAALRFYGTRCYACKARRGPLQIHHLTYIRFGGKELMSDLRPLCIPCHREVTALHWKMGKRKFTGQQVFITFMKLKSRSAPNTRKK